MQWINCKEKIFALRVSMYLPFVFLLIVKLEIWIKYAVDRLQINFKEQYYKRQWCSKYALFMFHCFLLESVCIVQCIDCISFHRKKTNAFQVCSMCLVFCPSWLFFCPLKCKIIWISSYSFKKTKYMLSLIICLNDFCIA